MVVRSHNLGGRGPQETPSLATGLKMSEGDAVAGTQLYKAMGSSVKCGDQYRGQVPLRQSQVVPLHPRRCLSLGRLCRSLFFQRSLFSYELGCTAWQGIGFHF